MYHLRCLQDNKYQKDFGKQCQEEIRSYEQEASTDYRLNHRLSKACKQDIEALCSGVCRASEGQVGKEGWAAGV